MQSTADSALRASMHVPAQGQCQRDRQVLSQLRDAGVGDFVSLPQVAIVGELASGKSIGKI
jgi:hypothetical protein